MHDLLRAGPRQEVADDPGMALFVATKPKERVSLVQELRGASTRRTAQLTDSAPAGIRSGSVPNVMPKSFNVPLSADVCERLRTKPDGMVSAGLVCGCSQKDCIWVHSCCLRVSAGQES